MKLTNLKVKDFGIERYSGTKIPWPETAVRVRVPPEALSPSLLRMLKVAGIVVSLFHLYFYPWWWHNQNGSRTPKFIGEEFRVIRGASVLKTRSLHIGLIM